MRRIIAAMVIGYACMFVLGWGVGYSNERVDFKACSPDTLWYYSPQLPPTLELSDEHYVKIRKADHYFEIRCLAFTGWSIEPNYADKECWKPEMERVR